MSVWPPNKPYSTHTLSLSVSVSWACSLLTSNSLQQRTSPPSASRSTPRQQTARSNTMDLPHFNAVLNMERFTTRRITIRWWHKYTNRRIIVDWWVRVGARRSRWINQSKSILAHKCIVIISVWKNIIIKIYWWKRKWGASLFKAQMISSVAMAIVTPKKVLNWPGSRLISCLFYSWVEILISKIPIVNMKSRKSQMSKRKRIK